MANRGGITEEKRKKEGKREKNKRKTGK